MKTEFPQQPHTPSGTRPNNQFACLSAKSRSAIATIWISGETADVALDRYFQSASQQRAKHVSLGQIAFGTWRSQPTSGMDAASSQTSLAPTALATGEDVVVCRLREDELEVHCHGGIAAQQAICRDLSALGFREISWLAWERLQANSLMAAEALASLRCALTERTAGILLDQLHGSLAREIVRAQEFLAANDQPRAQLIIDELLRNAAIGAHLVYPFQIVIAGRPNVGKSSLINCLLGYERAIVYDQPGTTRDVVTGRTALDGWPVELCDTAGLRTTGDEIEIEGVRRAMQAATRADLLVLVFDRSAAWTDAEQNLLDEYPSPLVVLNKCDIRPTDRASTRIIERMAAERGAICTVATAQQGIAELIAAMVRRLAPAVPASGSAVPFTVRQIQLLDQAAGALTANNRDTASALLRELTPADRI